MKKQVYPLKKTRASLVGAAILAGLFSLQMFTGCLGNSGIAATIGILALVGSPIGAYRGALALNLSKPITVTCTVLAFFAPLGMAIHLILLSKLPTPDEESNAAQDVPQVPAPKVQKATPEPLPVAPPTPTTPTIVSPAPHGFGEYAAKPSSAASFRQQMAEADTNRRKVLLSLLQQYPDDITPLVEVLISSASPETLSRVETMMANGQSG